MQLSRSSRPLSIARLTLYLIVLMLSLKTTQAQDLVRNSTGNPTTATETSVTDRVRILESELERQNSKLDQLQKTITDQQLALQALLERLSGERTRTQNTAINETSAN